MRNFGKQTLKLLLSAAILVAIAWKVDFGSLANVLSKLSAAWALLAFVLVSFQVIPAAARFSAVVRMFNRELSFRDSALITLESLFFAQTFISFLGGDALRIWRVRRCGASLNEAVRAVALDRLMGLFANHLVLLAALPWLLHAISAGHIRTVLVGVAFAGTAGICAFLLMGWQATLVQNIAAKFGGGRVVRLIIQLSTLGHHLLLPSKALAKCALYGLCIAIMNCGAFFAILSGLQVDLPTALACALIVPGVLEIAMLPVSIAGWGIREGAAIGAFGALGVQAATAFGTSVVFALMSLLVGLIGGAVWLMDTRKITASAAEDSLEGR
jgi:uncharacterized membrane protein YbhN (UPF0104 family)